MCGVLKPHGIKGLLDDVHILRRQNMTIDDVLQGGPVKQNDNLTGGRGVLLQSNTCKKRNIFRKKVN